MKKIILVCIIAISLSSKAQTDELETCIGSPTNTANCSSLFFSQVTAESGTPRTCSRGSIKVVFSKITPFSLGNTETIFLTATNNQTNKSYFSAIHGPTSNNQEPLIGVISGLPSGTYTVTSIFKVSLVSCSYTCSNIKVTLPLCPLLLCCRR